jgi:lipopolysaccharide export LptBFGC system permease protein LptF
MEGLIFIIPVLLVFLFFFIQIFLLFKKVFSYIFKNISELNQEITDNYNSTPTEDREETQYLFNQTLEKPEEDYIPITDRDINEINNKNNHEKDDAVDTKVNMQKSKDTVREKNKEEDLAKSKNRKSKSSASVLNFEKLNELEKAVIFKEILDRPRALRK